MKIVTCEQLSPEWWAARRGLPTASDFDRIVTPAKLAPSTQAESYICELAADIICQRPDYFTMRGRPISQAMQNGTDNEPAARKWYEMRHNVDCHRVGLCLSDDERLGCSPDGLVGDDGGLEIKCPELKTHLKYLLHGTLPDEYKLQVHGSLVVTGRKWWDFYSYCPPAKPFLIRVVPDSSTLKLKTVLAEFIVEYDRILADFGIERPAVDLEAR